MFTIRTTTFCCLLLVTQAADAPRRGGKGGGRGGAGPCGHGGAAEDWRKERPDQVGPDAANPDRGIGRPLATNLHRRGKVMSGTVESTCDFCKATERGAKAWGRCKGFLCGNAQIMPDPRKTGETRPCLAFWYDEDCKEYYGIAHLHPLFPGVEVMFVVVKGQKAHQVKAIMVERNLDRDFPAGTAQEDINMYSNQQQALKTVDRPKHVAYDTVKIKALYTDIGRMTQKLLVERAEQSGRRQPPKVDISFKDSMKGIMAQAQTEELDMEAVRQAVLQLIEELLNRSQNSSNRSGSPSASSDRSGTSAEISGHDSPHHAASSSAPAPVGRNAKTPQASTQLDPSASAWVPRRGGYDPTANLGQRARDARSRLAEEAKLAKAQKQQTPAAKKASFSDQCDFVVIHQEASPAPSARSNDEPTATIEEVIEEVVEVDHPQATRDTDSEGTQD